ncbi:MAG: hypothetical protein IIB95_00735 [Candidatus Marinimicrobia bacterium]|nr:hypothetical protein [Candidatus Neomarinimicrobiota bacterium]
MIVPVASGNPYFLVIDQGTSSTKCFLFDSNNEVVFTRRIKHQLIRPEPHHVECDAQEIADACKALIKECVQFAEEHSSAIHSAGLAVQRSTFLFWDKKTCEPHSPAISWQDDRAQDIVREFQNDAEWIFEKTGTPLNAHFGGAKFLHLIRKNSKLLRGVNEGNLWFGSLSAFLTHTLTGTVAIDHSIACRSQLLDLKSRLWDEQLCNLFQVPLSALPPLAPTSHSFGSISVDNITIPLNVVMGDQQAALIGQGGWKTNTIALNFGTSGSVQYNTGKTALTVDGLISSVLFSDDQHSLYMIEGTINACNSLFYWLEDELDIPHKEMRWHERCAATKTAGIFIPGFMGIAAPYWKSAVGIHRIGLDNASDNEIIRAAMESIGFLVSNIIERLDIRDQMPDLLTASGGGGRPPLLQFIADLLSIPVGHSSMKDRTALGVYYLLKKYAGETIEFPGTDCDMIFEPAMDNEVRKEKLMSWQSALETIGLL